MDSVTEENVEASRGGYKKTNALDSHAQLPRMICET